MVYFGWWFGFVVCLVLSVVFIAAYGCFYLYA